MGKIRKRGDTYVIDYYAGGKRYREAIGPKKKEAEDAMALKLQEIREGRHGGRRVKAVPVEVAVERYLQVFCPENEAGELLDRKHRDKKRYIEEIFQPHFKGRILTDISRGEIESLLAERRSLPTRYDTSRTAATCNREWAAIRHFLNTCAEWGLMRAAPCAGIRPQKEARGRVRYLTIEEAALLLEKANARLRPVLLTALETGMRKAEILGLRWEDVDYANRSLYVRKTKNGEPRHVPMSERLAAELKKLPRRVGVPYVFATKKGRPFGDMRTAFENACLAAGITNFRFHDLRHTAASHLAMAGVPMKAVGEILGHKTASMTQRYAHLSQDHLKAAVDSLPAWEKAKEK